MVIPGLSKNQIQQHANSQSVERGGDYFEIGAVISVIRRDDGIHAKVEGSEYEPYAVAIRFDDGGILSAHCSCPYEYGGWCKHIVAVLLSCLEEPDTIVQKGNLDEKLMQLDADNLRKLIQSLTWELPNVIVAVEDYLEDLIPASDPTASSPIQCQTAVDVNAIRKKVARVLNQAKGGYYEKDFLSDDYEIPGMDKIFEILQKTEDFLENGDGYNALLIVDAITEVWMEELGELEDIYGLDEEFMLTLDETWAEAFLTADLHESECQEWQEKLEDHANVYSFVIALTALAEGWEHPPLLKVFAGEIPEKGLWEDEDYPDLADNLAEIRLKILDRQQRYQDYLNLALAEGQTLLYLLMQVRVGAFDKALKEGLQWLGSADEALELAKVFREQQYPDEALRLAEHGLSLEGYAKKELASWTAELAKGMGAPEKALNATILGFKAQPTLHDYLAIQESANPREWQDLRNQLLEIVRSMKDDFAENDRVDIFLHEKLWKDAIGVVTNLHSFQAETIQRVMDVVLPHHPDWVAQNSRERAGRIMDEGKAKYYHYAIDWLRRTRDAYQHMGRQAEWQEEYETICQVHSRKNKLMGLLKTLR